LSAVAGNIPDTWNCSAVLAVADRRTSTARLEFVVGVNAFIVCGEASGVRDRAGVKADRAHLGERDLLEALDLVAFGLAGRLGVRRSLRGNIHASPFRGAPLIVGRALRLMGGRELGNTSTESIGVSPAV